jgi:UDP-N-acetylmuramate dehydrogenase
LDEKTSAIDVMEINHLKKILYEFGSNVKFDQDLKRKNWFNIGGRSKVFYTAENLIELIKFLKILNNKEKIFILGAGSNTLINDKLFDGIVIKLSKNFNNISLLGEDIIIAGGAVTDKSLSDFAMDNNLSGFEFLSCIPGTIGGGIRMNAGCFGKEFKDI